MRIIAHQLHSLDRQYRAAVCDVTRLTELYLIVAGCREVSEIPKSFVLQFPPTAASSSVAEMLKCITANIRELEIVALRLAGEKKSLARRLVRVVEDRVVAADQRPEPTVSVLR
jgi:hypothetical protein